MHDQISDECWAKCNALGGYDGFAQNSQGYASAINAVTQEMVAKFNDLVAKEAKVLAELNDKQK